MSPIHGPGFQLKVLSAKIERSKQLKIDLLFEAIDRSVWLKTSIVGLSISVTVHFNTPFVEKRYLKIDKNAFAK